MSHDAIACAPWTLDDYADRLRARGFPVHHHDGVWWQQVKPQFCWPVDFTAALPPTAKPARHASLLGYQFVVADEALKSSWFNPMLCDDLGGYSLERMDGARRNGVRKGLKSVVVRPIGKKELLRDGWQVRHEFHARTGWGRPLSQREWPAYVENQFRAPRIDHALGAFAGDRLVSYMTWYGAGRTATMTSISASSETGRLAANDALLYVWMCALRDSGHYDRAVSSVRSLKPSLDLFKHSHLFRLQSLPARLALHPVARGLLRASRPEALERLDGLDADAAREWLAQGKTSAQR